MSSEMIGKYEIVEKRGEGGFGVLFRAWDTVIERVVALKVLHPQFASNERLSAWFKREAKAMARLNHQNIVTIHNFEIESGRHFIVMEYVDGDNVSEMLKKNGPLPIDDAIKIVLQLADGFGYAHQGGIIHRDIKPSNIMVDPSGKVKITDFGIAKILDDTKLTKTSSGAGSLHYMSPEQIDGKTVDARSDIYSLGITMYQMVTGKVPFTDDSEYVVMRAHLNQEPTPPAQLRPDTPPALESVILRMLAKKPDDRYESMKSMSVELRRAFDPLAANDLTIDLRKRAAAGPRKPVGTNREETKRGKGIGLILGVVALVAVVLVTSYFMFFQGGETPVDDVALVDSSLVSMDDSMSADMASSDSALASIDSAQDKSPDTVVEPPSYRGKLVIDVSPFDYRDRPTVSFDGKTYEIEDIPYEINGIKPGRHRVAVHYKDNAFFEDIQFDEDTQSRTYKFNGPTGRVSIGAEFIGQDKQPWAEILVDGKPIDKGTPTSLDLIEGPHKVAVQKDGYELVGNSKIVDVKAGENTSVSFKLRRK